MPAWPSIAASGKQLVQAGRSARSPLPDLDPAFSRLTEVHGFGSNPGALRMFKYVPERPEPALVVVLHGCTQTAASYDFGAGWSTLADRYGFVLLLPQQQPANNPNKCFNWFLADDIERGKGEALSIRQMVEAMIRDHGIDRRRVFVTGLSAGGAMTSVMLATYPEIFAAGAVIAGLAVPHRDQPPRGVREHVQGARPPGARMGRFRPRCIAAPAGRGRAYRSGTAAPTRW